MSLLRIPHFQAQRNPWKAMTHCVCNGATAAAICLGVDLVVGDNVHHLRWAFEQNGRSQPVHVFFGARGRSALRLRGSEGGTQLVRWAAARLLLFIDSKFRLPRPAPLRVSRSQLGLTWIQLWSRWIDVKHDLQISANICSFQSPTFSTTTSTKVCPKITTKLSNRKQITRISPPNPGGTISTQSPIKGSVFARTCSRKVKYIRHVSTVSTLLMVSLT